MKIKLETGSLEVQESLLLTSLVGYGSRINKKRGFLFVSKVLGKHLPTKPSLMQETYQSLAKLIPVTSEVTLYIGFAETATALGQGVFEENATTNSFYIHSTRFQTSEPILFSFFEEHCHAPSHIFYEPKSMELKELLHKVTRVILIDDEVSTGNTANNLVNEIKKILPQVQKYYLLTILNWSEKKYDNFEYLSLYKGRFTFESNKNIDFSNSIISEPLKVKNLDSIIPYNFARYGVKKISWNFDKLIDILPLKMQKILVLGTAEFMYPPYQFAHYLEDNGIDVYFQATTRSPVNVDGKILSKLAFKDNYFEEIDNFLYNVLDKEYDVIFLCYETTTLPKSYMLKEYLQEKYLVKELFFNEEIMSV